MRGLRQAHIVTPQGGPWYPVRIELPPPLQSRLQASEVRYDRDVQEVEQEMAVLSGEDIDQTVRSLMEQGWSEQDARKQANQELGDWLAGYCAMQRERIQEATHRRIERNFFIYRAARA